MAVRWESDCVDCGFPCLRESCPHYKVKIYECDKCHDEVEKLYYGVNGDELCADCALKELEIVE